MQHVPFVTRFPEVGAQETRTITVLKDDGRLPADAYSLVEMFCTEPDCDCRRVFFSIWSGRLGKVVATLAWGWGSRDFYLSWGHGDKTIADEMVGLTIPPMSLQVDMALTHELQKAVATVLEAAEYRDRIKRHYQMWTAALRAEAPSVVKTVRKPAEAGRNEPCPCGSAKKYKKCCLQVAV